MSVDYVNELVGILERLRGEGGCPWDREQTHRTLKRFLIEEVGELLDAIDDRDDRAMVDELGDVLLQIVFHCQIAREEGRFSFQDAARAECEKMVRRHPHVFGEASVSSPDAVVDQWEEIKQTERDGEAVASAVDGVPRSLPALHRAQKIQRKAAKAGFEWPDLSGALAKVDEEMAEVKSALAAGDEAAVIEELGDLLFAVVNVCRWRRVEAEDVLQQAIRKFDRRFRALEADMGSDDGQLPHCDTAEMLARWRRTASRPGESE